jgi:hypothetical protein
MVEELIHPEYGRESVGVPIKLSETPAGGERTAEVWRT